jgi:hypothetical protein
MTQHRPHQQIVVFAVVLLANYIKHSYHHNGALITKPLWLSEYQYIFTYADIQSPLTKNKFYYIKTSSQCFFMPIISVLTRQAEIPMSYCYG